LIYQFILYINVGLTNGSIKDGHKFCIPFLPVSKEYPPIRNQARQKLARLSDKELKSLVALILIECHRRQHDGATDYGLDKDMFLLSLEDVNKNIAKDSINAPEDDEFPLYDSVPSDDDAMHADKHTVISSRVL